MVDFEVMLIHNTFYLSKNASFLAFQINRKITWEDGEEEYFEGPCVKYVNEYHHQKEDGEIKILKFITKVQKRWRGKKTIGRF